MNLVTVPATYAAISRELGLPLRYPGNREGWNTLQETTDAELFGRATLWALGEDKARNEIFNVSNGDVYRWRQMWSELAAFYDIPVAEPLAMSTVSEMSEKGPPMGRHGCPLRTLSHALRAERKRGSVCRRQACRGRHH
jgi:hypothetical protein